MRPECKVDLSLVLPSPTPGLRFLFSSPWPSLLRYSIQCSFAAAAAAAADGGIVVSGLGRDPFSLGRSVLSGVFPAIDQPSGTRRPRPRGPAVGQGVLADALTASGNCVP